MHDETLPAAPAKTAHFCSMRGPHFCSMRISPGRVRVERPRRQMRQRAAGAGDDLPRVSITGTPAGPGTRDDLR
jgi:hypothetical protein